MPGFMQGEESAPPSSRPGFALWQLGFRPFYLLASTFAALAALWLAGRILVLTRPCLDGRSG